MNNDKADFTQGSILKKLIAFMIPVLGALILQAAYGAVDLLVVGRFGSTSGLSAVSTGSQVLNLVTFVVIQFAMGITVLIARYLGEKKPQQIGAVVGGASIVFTLISAVLFVVMVFFARPIAILMQAPEEAPQGMKQVVMMVMRRSRSFSMVREAMTPGTPQPVPTSTGMKLLPDRPNLRKIRSMMKATRDI